MNVYAIDCDDTLEVLNGPVKLIDLMALRNQGHVVGTCGNWPAMVCKVPDWMHRFSFIYQLPGDQKAKYLIALKTHIVAEEYIFVGNCDRGHNDQVSALEAGWRFIKESDFAAGAR